jgi:hypothetical protein
MIMTKTILNKVEHENGTYNTHRYNVQFHYNGTLTCFGHLPGTESYNLKRVKWFVDGDEVTADDPLFVEVKGDPVQTIKDYIDRSES